MDPSVVDRPSDHEIKIELVVDRTNAPVSDQAPHNPDSGSDTEPVSSNEAQADSSGNNVETSNSSFEDAIPSLRFPQKLWRIVNECRSGAIGWGPDGLSVLVDYDSFQREYLSGSDSGIFKTNNMASFIRQLNLYGFRKLTSHNREIFAAKTLCSGRLAGTAEQKVHEFLHENFRQGRLDLLSRVCRKTGVKKSSQLARQAKLLKEGRLLKVQEYDARGNGMTKLQMCQLALTEALAEATKQYQKEKQLWMNSFHYNRSEDTVQTNCKVEPVENQFSTRTEPVEPIKIEIVFQDLPQFQAIESLPIIDATGLENVIDNHQDKIQWSEVLTLPGENTVTISVPYL